MNQIFEVLTEIAKDIPGGLPVFYAFLFVGLCAVLTLILEMMLEIYKNID